jgi:hypothetical protein
MSEFTEFCRRKADEFEQIRHVEKWREVNRVVYDFINDVKAQKWADCAVYFELGVLPQ